MSRLAAVLLPAVSLGQLVIPKNGIDLPDMPMQATTPILKVHEPKICDDVKQYSGYLKTSKKALFFWFFESRHQPKSDPTLMWLTGGPGCSSQLALLAENGPCRVNKDGKTTTKNPFSWNTRANALWIDQPAGSGFSGGTWDTTSTEAADDVYDFLLHFFDQFPQYNHRFFIFGESYAGHYVPATAHAIFTGNKKAKTKIDLEGFSIGNGLTDPEEQYLWYPEMAFHSKYPAVSPRAYGIMKAAAPYCQWLIKQCNGIGGAIACTIAFTACNLAMLEPYQSTGKNPYDMSKMCEVPPLCYDFSLETAYLNNKEVQKEIGVGMAWQSCNMLVNLFFRNDWMHNYHQVIPEMLEAGVRVLIYAGDLDYVCNWMGNYHWALKLKWEGHTAFNSASDVEWKKHGLLRKAGNFAFLKVFEAGHMVPMDQPAAALDMVNSFLNNTLPDTTHKMEPTGVQASLFDETVHV